MQCPYCDHAKAHQHDRTNEGNQRFKCPRCGKIFTETINTMYYRRQIMPEDVGKILQSHTEDTRLRGVVRVSHRAYGAVISVLRSASQKAQLVRNKAVQSVKTQGMAPDEM